MIQRQYAVLAAIQVDQRARRVKGQAARIDDPGIAAERPGEITLGAEAEDRAVAVAVSPAGTGDQDAHHDHPFIRPYSGMDAATTPSCDHEPRS